MPKSDQGSRREGSREPFVAQEDRPEVRISLDTPISELHVRELSAILGYMAQKSPFEAGKTSLKDFFDKDFPEVAKDWAKEIKIEKVEKPEKPEKAEKNEKLEKNEKHEHKEFKFEKLEKLESDGVIGPRLPPGPDPRIDQVIQAVAGLAQQVSHLANQMEEMRRKG